MATDGRTAAALEVNVGTDRLYIDDDGWGTDGESARIATYFSHSYRRDDRTINRIIHDLCWKHGFALTVDPQSGPLSTTHLEIMMKASACFLAVVTRRTEQERYQCSPFAVYECDLAMLGRLPRLVLVERGVAAANFLDREHQVVFDRDRLPIAKIEGQLARLKEESRPRLDVGDRLLGKVGLLLPDTPAYREVTPLIGKILDRAGYTPHPLDLRNADGVAAARVLDDLDFVVAELHQGGPDGHLMPFVQGRFIPTMKLVHHRPGASGGPIGIPSLYLDPALMAAAKASELAIWWQDPDELVAEFAKRIEVLSVPRRAFRSRAEGEAYFRSLGHRRGPVFVSNAGLDNDLARALVDRLRSYNIQPFHYVFENTIPPGERWKPFLPRKVEESEIFVPLVSRAYWESDYCRQEFDTAIALHRQGRLRVVPCFLDDHTEGPEIDIQGISLVGLDAPHRVHRIAAFLDDELSPEARRPTPATITVVPPGQPLPRVDIAILTVLEEEYEAVYRHLEDPRQVPGTRDRPNRYSWVTGAVPGGDQGPYRVVLALGRTGTEEALLATRNTVDAFRPQNVLLVGVAGAVDPRLGLGDVVVADRIVGYEYGKLANGYHPRPDLSFPTDQSVTAAARTMTTRHRDWSRSILVPPPEPREDPQVLVGPVASGNKVVDRLDEAVFDSVVRLWPSLVAVEMEALGSVRAVDEARERGGVGHFSMIRGISDLPVGGARSPLGQSRQRDRWKPYAAATAAAYAVALIRTSWPQPPGT